MRQVHLGSPTQDVEVVTLSRFLEQGGVQDLSDREKIQQAIEERKAVLRWGLSHPTAQFWTRKLQKEVEPLLRMRMCPKRGFVIDRWIAEQGYWHQIPGAIGFDPPRPGLCERMRDQYDMWKRSSPKADQDAAEKGVRHPLLKEQDQKSRVIQKANEQKSTDKVLAAVDGMSEKQIGEFVAVERALQTGEKVVAHGRTLTIIERMAEASKKAPAIPEDSSASCVNPGMNPFVYKRSQGGKHIRE